MRSLKQERKTAEVALRKIDEELEAINYEPSPKMCELVDEAEVLLAYISTLGDLTRYRKRSTPILKKHLPGIPIL